MAIRELATDPFPANGDLEAQLAAVVHPKNKLNELTGREWIQHTKSVWFQKGLGQGHDHAQIERLHPAPFSYQDVMRLIEFFTKSGESVLDPFVGVGSTLKACAISGRRGTGIELVETWVEASKLRLRTELPPELQEAGGSQVLIQGDSRDVLATMPNEQFAFAVTSPPYWGILNKPADHKVLRNRVDFDLATNYSDDERDLANLESYPEFLEELGHVFSECRRVLMPRRYLAVIVGDFRHKSEYIPYHSHIIDRLTSGGNADRFELAGIVILAQNSKKLYPYGYPYAFVPNVHHQYILVFRKPADEEKRDGRLSTVRSV